MTELLRQAKLADARGEFEKADQLFIKVCQMVDELEVEPGQYAQTIESFNDLGAIQHDGWVDITKPFLEDVKVNASPEDVRNIMSDFNQGVLNSEGEAWVRQILNDIMAIELSQDEVRLFNGHVVVWLGDEKNEEPEEEESDTYQGPDRLEEKVGWDGL